MAFWSEFWSASNEKVHTPQVILLAIAILLMLLAIAIIIYHSFYKGKGLDGEVVKLILGLLGGGVVNAGASYFSKTTVSSLTRVGSPPVDNPDAPPPTSGKAAKAQ